MFGLDRWIERKKRGVGGEERERGAIGYRVSLRRNQYVSGKDNVLPPWGGGWNGVGCEVDDDTV